MDVSREGGERGKFVTGGCFGVRVQHSLGVSRSVCSWYWGRLGLGTLALTSLVTVQVRVVRGVLECWTLAAIPILATQVLGSLLQFKFPTRDGGSVKRYCLGPGITYMSILGKYHCAVWSFLGVRGCEGQ